MASLRAVEKGSFWAFSAEHQNLIKSVTFDVSAPNMFNDRNDFQNEFRSLRDNENVNKMKNNLESDTSLNLKTDRMEDVIDYTEKGGGKLYARAVDGSTYSSEDHSKKISVQVEPHSKGDGNFLRQIVNWLDWLF